MLFWKKKEGRKEERKGRRKEGRKEGREGGRKEGREEGKKVGRKEKAITKKEKDYDRSHTAPGTSVVPETHSSKPCFGFTNPTHHADLKGGHMKNHFTKNTLWLMQNTVRWHLHLTVGCHLISHTGSATGSGIVNGTNSSPDWGQALHIHCTLWNLGSCLVPFLFLKLHPIISVLFFQFLDQSDSLGLYWSSWVF